MIIDMRKSHFFFDSVRLHHNSLSREQYFTVHSLHCLCSLEVNDARNNTTAGTLHLQCRPTHRVQGLIPRNSVCAHIKATFISHLFLMMLACHTHFHHIIVLAHNALQHVHYRPASTKESQYGTRGRVSATLCRIPIQLSDVALR